MEGEIKYTIDLHPGEWTVKRAWVSYLNYVMVTFYNEEGKTLDVNTRKTIDEFICLPGINKITSEETNFPDLDIIY